VATAGVVARLTGARLLERRPAGPATGRSIDALARREGADLVVVATGAESSVDVTRLSRPALDSRFMVLVVPPRAPTGLRLERIGMGYDGGPAAQRALTAVADIVKLAGRAVTSLDVVYVDDEAAEPDARALRSSRAVLIAWWLGSVSDDLPAPVRSLRLEGDPSEALADLSQDLDLLVVGTGSRGWLRRLVAGSVSTRLLARTRCPLLVVPERSTP
jgi:nucleotide-binding universal stress UspA family protein